jgi:hypothetical protein
LEARGFTVLKPTGKGFVIEVTGPPHTLADLIKQEHPDLTDEEVEEILQTT